MKYLVGLYLTLSSVLCFAETGAIARIVQIESQPADKTVMVTLRVESGSFAQYSDIEVLMVSSKARARLVLPKGKEKIMAGEEVAGVKLNLSRASSIYGFVAPTSAYADMSAVERTLRVLNQATGQ